MMCAIYGKHQRNISSQQNAKTINKTTEPTETSISTEFFFIADYFQMNANNLTRKIILRNAVCFLQKKQKKHSRLTSSRIWFEPNIFKVCSHLFFHLLLLIEFVEKSLRIINQCCVVSTFILMESD